MKKRGRETKLIVRQLLIEYPELKDSDLKLITHIWEYEITKLYGDGAKVFHPFLALLRSGGLTSPETIRRSRCKLQEENEHLRGERYNQRKKYGEIQTDNLEREFLTLTYDWISQPRKRKGF